MILEDMRVDEINWGVCIEEAQQIHTGEILLKLRIRKNSKGDGERSDNNKAN